MGTHLGSFPCEVSGCGPAKGLWEAVVQGLNWLPQCPPEHACQRLFELADHLVAIVENMRTSIMWAPVLAELPEMQGGGEAAAGSHQPTHFQGLLSGVQKGRESKILSVALLRRLHTCFGPLVSSCSPQLLCNMESPFDIVELLRHTESPFEIIEHTAPYLCSCKHTTELPEVCCRLDRDLHGNAELLHITARASCMHSG